MKRKSLEHYSALSSKTAVRISAKQHAKKISKKCFASGSLEIPGRNERVFYNKLCRVTFRFTLNVDWREKTLLRGPSPLKYFLGLSFQL